MTTRALATALRHARARTRALLTSPADLALLAIAAATSHWAWNFVVRALLQNREQDYLVVLLVFAIPTLWLWPWLLVRPLCGGRVSLGRHWHRALPMPSLPISLRSRLLTEATVGLALVTLAAVPFSILLTPSLFGLWDHVSVFSWLLFAALELSRALRWSLSAAFLVFPVLLAWMAPSRGEVAHSFRPLVVAALAVGGLVAPPAVTSAGAAWQRTGLVGAGLSVLVLLVLMRVEGDAGDSRPFRGSLTRDAIGPEARLRGDLGGRAVGALWPSLVAGLVVLFAGLLLRNAGVVGKLGHLVSVTCGFALLARSWTQPFGIGVFETDALASSRSLFGGAYARAWAGLPVPRVAVRRAVYLHGLVSAALVSLALAAHSQLAALLGVPWWSNRDDVAFALAVPSAAGFLLCAAVGDRLVGTLSAAATVSIPPVYAFRLSGLDLGLSAEAHLGLLVGLALLGGVPPILHLGHAPARRTLIPASAAALAVLALFAPGCRPDELLCIAPPSRSGVPPPAVEAIEVADPVWMSCTDEGPRPAAGPVLPSLRTADESVEREPPRPVRLAQPCYPEDAFAKGVQGVVTIELLVDAGGRVAEAGVVRSIPELDAASLEVVCRWSFVPAREAGQPVPHVARAPVSFAIY